MGTTEGKLESVFVSADSVKAAICAKEEQSTSEAQLEESPKCVMGVWG